MKRGAYFFVLDAFIAGIIIISSLIIVFSSLTVSESPTQDYVLAEDFMQFMESTKVRDYGGLFVYEMIQQGVITDRSVSLLEQTVLLYEQSKNAAAPEELNLRNNLTGMLDEVSAQAPENNGIAFYIIDGEEILLYNSSAGQPDARASLIAKRIAMARDVNGVTPYVVEVRLWR